MTSVALAVTRDGGAGTVVGRILAAMTDRSPAWTVAGSELTAVGVGAGDLSEARCGFHEPGGQVRIAVDAPEWMRPQLRQMLSGMTAVGPAPTDEIAGRFSALTGDVHCAAAVGTQACVLYRGPMSSRPLFYAVSGDRSLLAATQIRGIRAVLPSRVSLAGLASFLVPQMCDPTGTAWAGIRRLAPGHALIYSGGELAIREVAHVAAADIASAVRSEVVAEFRDRLFHAVLRCSQPPDGLLLSGGIDSSSLACAYRAARDGACRAFALTYDQRLAPCDERRFVDDVERATGIPVSRLDGTRLLPLVAGFPEGDEPEPWAYAARNWAMLRHITASREEMPTAVIAGEGGDELLLGQVFAVADRSARGDPDGAAREIKTFPDPDRAARVVDGLLSGDYDRPAARVVRALTEVPPWLNSRYVAAHHIVDRLAAGYPRLGEPGCLAASYSRTLIAEAGAAGRVQCGGWWEDTGRKVGVEITYPFLDPDLAALIWSLPPELLRDDGIEKVILREALTGLLPTSVARRRGKAEALALMHAGLSESAEAIRAVGRGGPLADSAVIKPDRLSSCVDDYLAGRSDLGPALWATVAVDRWLRHQDGHATEWEPQ